MLGPAEVRALLGKHGIAPHKSFGQNFVVDANTVRKVVRDAGVEAGDLVVEIGPGLGSLTLALRAAGARVTAIEIDAGMVRALSDVVGADPQVTVIHADAMAVDLAEVTGAAPALLVANLPYNAATPLLMHALRSHAFTRMLLMVQREAGERWTATVGDPLYSGVSVKVAALASVRVAARVSRRAFYPVPNVDSVTVEVRPRPAPPDDVDHLFALVDAGFRQRRKRLRNSLGQAGVTAPAAEAALTAIGADPGARAEELDVGTWQRLATALR
jgi:16S rRNA (adenine1518-N6/adenine1519-N6)-dimethyltransferase